MYFSGVFMLKSSHFRAARAKITVPATTARVAAEGTGKLKPLECVFSRFWALCGLLFAGFSLLICPMEAKTDEEPLFLERAGFCVNWFINPLPKPADL